MSMFPPGEWKCTGCGAIVLNGEPVSEDDRHSSWRNTGSYWEHKCPDSDPQCGHQIAEKISEGPIVEAVYAEPCSSKPETLFAFGKHDKKTFSNAWLYSKEFTGMILRSNLSLEYLLTWAKSILDSNELEYYYVLKGMHGELTGFEGAPFKWVIYESEKPKRGYRLATVLNIRGE